MHEETEAVVDDKLGFIQKVINTGDYDVAVKESCTLFEMVFKKIFQQAIVSLPYKDREEILQTERKVGKGKKGVQDFTFGELVGLLRESNLLDKWSKYTAKDLGLIKTLDYSSIVNLRNRITHDGMSCSRGEANIVYEYLRNLLAVLGFADLDESINLSFKKREAVPIDSIPSTIDGENKDGKDLSINDRLPKIIKKSKYKSVYSSTYGNEGSRLQIQADNVREFDLKAFDKIIEQSKDKTNLLGLDLGCASGDITIDRFGKYDQFEHVIGIDINPTKINEAKEKNSNKNRFSFYEMDIESEQFEGNMQDILSSIGNRKFDVIFSALTIHHLSNPLKALFKLRKLLNKGGFLILRGSDDGTKFAFPDEQNLVQSLVYLTSDVQGVSDRQNGRKMYYQMWRSGFRNIELKYSIKDTSGLTMEDRHALFQESFAYRINYFEKQLNSDPQNKRYQEEYQWVLDALEELELEFLNESFFYAETDFIAIGRK